MKPFDTLVELRKNYPTPMSKAQLGALLNAVAWAHRAEGYGLLRKPSGNHTTQPGTGIPIAQDIITHGPSNIPFDVLRDGEGDAEPVWNKKGAYAPERFVAPVDSSVALPQPLTQPLTPPLTPAAAVTQSYPDEATWWTALFEEIDRLYRLANHAPDLGTFKWSTRMAYDIGTGMDKEKAKAKHLAELRAALGLGSSA